jgi:hypothetical protein
MSVRIHELAKKYNKDSKELLGWLKERGFVSADTKSVAAPVSRIFFDDIDKALAMKDLPLASTPVKAPVAAPEKRSETHRIPLSTSHSQEKPKQALNPALEISRKLETQPSLGGATSTLPIKNPTATNGTRFESEVDFVMDKCIPEQYIAGVPLFPCDTIGSNASRYDDFPLSTEVDFLLHVRRGMVETLLIVEVKSTDILGEPSGPLKNQDTPARSSGPWNVWSSDRFGNPKLKNVKVQMTMQARALILNVEPLEGRHKFKCKGILIGQRQAQSTNPLTSTEGAMDFELVPFGGLSQWLADLEKDHEILRVQQSPVLRRLRQGQPVPNLGHPELANAVSYARRVRAFLDSELLNHFEPKGRHWAINGSAGMGKSVLLGYTLSVLVTDRELARLGDGTPYLKSFSRSQEIGLPPIEKRRIILTAHSSKQKWMLEEVYQRFERRFDEIDPFNEHRRIKPTFRVWSEISDDDLKISNILLIDEAHDLNPAAELRIRDWFDRGSDHFLVIACDRHQKLRLIHKDTRIMGGFDFSGCTTRLVRNYRNPFPVHAAAVGLLFRWFPAQGPKVFPSKDDLSLGLGFKVNERSVDNVVLEAREDAHPGNNWSHLVGRFASPGEIMEQLRELPLRKEDVLWVRFSDEDPDFGYEQLDRFTYHNLLGPDAADLTDKYIKGQEFPIVVLEGMPKSAAWGDLELLYPDSSEEERLRLMWQARRLAYLAASRATLFLFFVIGDRDPVDFRNEIRTLVGQLSRPAGTVRQSVSGKIWSVAYSPGKEAWDLPRYLRALGSEFAVSAEDATTSMDLTRNPAGTPTVEVNATLSNPATPDSAPAF